MTRDQREVGVKRIQPYFNMISPFVVTVMRTKRRSLDWSCAKFRRLQRELLQQESARLFVIELLIFGVLADVSAWPIMRAIEALRRVIQLSH
jgi:hypothetical protein